MLKRDGEIRGDSRFSDPAFAAGDRDDVLDAADSRRADSGRAAARWWRLNIDPHFGVTDAGEIAQRPFRFVLDRLRNGGVARGERELHDDVAIACVDSLDQAKRNDIAAETRIFHGLKRFFDLILGDSHGSRSYRVRSWSKD